MVDFDVCVLLQLTHTIYAPTPLQSIPLPFCAKHFDYSEIETYEARQYRPLRDFGGWGIRFGRSGRAYTVSGNQGVQFVFKNGQRLLIGSQHADRLVEAVDHNMKSVNG